MAAKKKNVTARPADRTRQSKSKPMPEGRYSAVGSSKKTGTGRVTQKMGFLDPIGSDSSGKSNTWEYWTDTVSDAVVKPRVIGSHNSKTRYGKM